MARSKQKIRIVNPKRLVVAAAVVLAVLVLLISLITGLFAGDKIQKQIEKTEGSDVVITDRRFSASLPDGSSVELGDVIAFKLVYCYQLEDNTLKSYEVTEDILITIDGATEDEPSTIGAVSNNTVQILQTAKEGEEIAIIVSHKYMEDVTFTYVVGNSEIIE